MSNATSLRRTQYQWHRHRWPEYWARFYTWRNQTWLYGKVQKSCLQEGNDACRRCQQGFRPDLCQAMEVRSSSGKHQRCITKLLMMASYTPTAVGHQHWELISMTHTDVPRSCRWPWQDLEKPLAAHADGMTRKTKKTTQWHLGVFEILVAYGSRPSFMIIY